MESPSSKVVAQLVVGMVAAVLAHLAADQAWLEFLPPAAAGPVGVIVGALAGYYRRELNPPQSVVDAVRRGEL